MTAPTEQAGASTVTIVAFGDSMTAPRPGQVQRVYGERLVDELDALGIHATVVNAGVGGNTTNDARERFPADVLSHDPEIVILQFGANDASVRIFEQPPRTRPQVELTAFAANLEDLLRGAKARGVRAICIGSPPLRWAPRTRELYDGPPYRPDDVDGFGWIAARYADQMRRVAAAEGVPFIDLDAAIRAQRDPIDAFLLDGLHPNDRGHALIARLLTAQVCRILSGGDRGWQRNTPERVWVHPSCSWLPAVHQGPFVALDDDTIFTANHGSALISADEGRTWTETALFPPELDHVLAQERVIARTPDGVLVVAFVDNATRYWDWDRTLREAVPHVRADVYAVRSTDGGRTWERPVLVQRGYCGAVRGLIHTRSGALVLTAQDLRRKPSRHVSYTYTSTDAGQSWTRSAPLDVGGHGHHDGSVEGTLAELRDGRLWILLRTAFGFFYQAFSADDGRTWHGFGPTAIDASGSPGWLLRLASGRLCLVWNRRLPAGERTAACTEDHASIVPASTQRAELSIAFSDDDGTSWSAPVVIARNEPGQRVSYPFVFERRPGELWITTMQGFLRIRVSERDLLPPP